MEPQVVLAEAGYVLGAGSRGRVVWVSSAAGSWPGLSPTEGHRQQHARVRVWPSHRRPSWCNHVLAVDSHAPNRNNLGAASARRRSAHRERVRRLAVQHSHVLIADMPVYPHNPVIPCSWHRD